MAEPAKRLTTETCYLCSLPAHRHCEQCLRPICVVHTRSIPRLSWQVIRDPQESQAQSWSQYLPDPTATPWQVCPSCGQEIQRHDAREKAREQRNTWIRRGIYLLLIVAIVAVTLLFHR